MTLILVVKEMLNKNQNQSTGNSCTAIQAETIIVNSQVLSYEDVSKICHDIFEQNFYKLSAEAYEIATKRAQELIEEFLRELKSQNPDGLNQVIDPDFQYDLFIAQREYARCGDSILLEMLTRFLIERTKETEKTLKQIVLNESLNVTSKLTEEEFNILTIIFVLQHHSEQHTFHNTAEFANYIAAYILPFWSSTGKEDSLRAHLLYTGCGSHLFFRVTNLEDFLKSKYNGLPLENFSSLKTSIEGVDPRIKSFFDLFENSLVNHMFLTTVGIAIGYANLCRVIDEKFDLSNWI